MMLRPKFQNMWWAALCVMLVSQSARADKVVLLPSSGIDDEDAADAVEDGIAESVRSLGHEVSTDALQARGEPPPETANEMKAVADVQSAQWVVVPVGRGDKVVLRVGYAAENREEQFDLDASDARDRAKLKVVLAAMLRREGLGNDSARIRSELAQMQAQTTPAPEPTPPPRENRPTPQRTTPSPVSEVPLRKWSLQGGMGIYPVLVHDSRAHGDLMGAWGFRIGRSLEKVPGLELRGGFDIFFGDSSAGALHFDTAYIRQLFPSLPLRFGAELDVGFFQPITGNRSPSFLLRAAGIVQLALTQRWFLEASLPELMFLSANGGGLTLGASLRAGFRF